MSSRPVSAKTRPQDKEDEPNEATRAKTDKPDQDSGSNIVTPTSTSATGKTSNTGATQSRPAVRSSYYDDDRPGSRGGQSKWDRSKDHRDIRPSKYREDYSSVKKRDSREMSHSSHGRGDLKGKGHDYRERDGNSSSSRVEFVSGDLRRQPDGSKAFIDDSRLSKLVRRLVKEDDRERKLTAIKQLKDYLLGHENTKTIIKSSDNLLIALHDILQERTFKDTKDEASICIGIIGCLMGSESHRYFEWLFAKLTSASNDDARIQLLTALHETVKQDGLKKKLEEYMPAIMENCRSILENADASELLKAVMDTILLIAKYHPHVFGNHFRDTVDILVGWHIDATQKEELTVYTSEALISFHPFWIGDTGFSLTLLGQFLEDLEAYSEDLSLGVNGQHAGDEEMPSPEECLTKIGALLRVFTTVIKSLGEYFNPELNSVLSVEYISDNLERIVACVSSVMKLSYYEKVLGYANICVMSLIGDLGGHLRESQPTILTYVTGQCQQLELTSNTYVKSLLNLTQKVVELVNTQLPVTFITNIMGTGSLFHKLRFAQSTEVLKEMMALYHAIMLLKNVPLLEEAYRHMLGDMEIAYNVLLKDCDCEPSFHIVNANPFAELNYNFREAQAAFIFDICTLAEISNTKNNIIGMYALSPSIFDLLTQHLFPGHMRVIERYPAVQYATLQTLYSHCTRHGHFITSSHLITQNTESTVLANLSAQAGGHFSTILSTLSELLCSEATSHDAKRLGLEWSIEIIDALTTAQHIYRTNEFKELADAVVTLGFIDDSEITVRVCKGLQKYMKNTNRHNRHILKRCKELCNIRMACTDRAIREPFVELLQQIPISINTRSQNKGQSLIWHKKPRVLVHDGEAYWKARRGHMQKIPMGTFHTHNFRSIMAYILEGTPPAKIGCETWLERLFHTSQRSDKETRKDDSAQLAALIDSSESLQWFWATWEAAQFCIMSKLRTPLGKPQETLPTIESALKNYSNQVKSKDGEESPSPKEIKGDKYMAQIRVTLLLQFMENLEKQLYNAYEGCAVAMVTPPKTVRSFFRTNRSTCEDWLTRVRMCIISIAAHCGKPALVIRQAYEILADMVDKRNTNLPEFDQVVMHTVKALCELRCPDALTGLYTWCKEEAGKRMPWIKSAIEFANGRYEPAVEDFKSALNNYINPPEASVSEESKENAVTSAVNSGGDGDSPRTSVGDGDEEQSVQRFSLLSKHHGGHGSGTNNSPDPQLAKFMVNQVCEGYLKLGSWQDVLEWQETLQTYRSEYTGSSLQNAFYTDTDVNYLKALSMFDDLDFMAVRETLDLVPGCSISDISNNQGMEPDVVWDRDLIITSAHKQFIRAVTNCITSDLKHALDVSLRKLESCQELCKDLIRVGSLDSPPQSYGPAVMELRAASVMTTQLLTTKNVKDLFLPMCETVKLDAQEHDVSMAMNALTLLIVQDNLQATLYPDTQIDFSQQIATLRLATANLARKQSNLILAERLIIEEIVGCVELEPEAEMPETVERAMSVLGDVQTVSGVKNSVHIIRLEREAAKLQHFKGHHRDGIEAIVAAVVRHADVVNLKPSQHRALIKAGGEMNARSLVTLVQWFQTDHKFLNQLSPQIKSIGQEDAAPTEVARNLHALLQLEEKAVADGNGITIDDNDAQGVRIGDNQILSDSDAIVGRMLHLATVQSPNLAKAWFALAGWCNKWGRKAVDNAVHGSVELSVDEKAQVLELLPKGTSNEEIESVLSILSQIQCGGSSEEDISDQEMYDDGTETTRKQLLSSCLSLQIASDECVERLIDVWRGVVKRVYHYYQLSAKAYLTYLKINGQCCDDQTNMDGNITATLRLLRLLVKHAWELRGVLENGLASTPTAPWKGIIPQLFSRLNHPEPYVRQSVSDLLCRVAQDAPHLIVYPAVVGCCTDKSAVKDTDRDGLLNAYLLEKAEEITDDAVDPSPSSQDDEPGVQDDGDDAFLKNCFTDIVHTLSRSNPQMIQEVELLVGELRRVTLLWDELWLGTLNQHHADVTRRLTQLENEVKKVVANNSLSKEEKTAIIAEKHRTILKPTVYTMERVHDITRQPAETAHERWFQQTYNKQIEEALDRLNNPINPSHPQTSWHQFKQIHHSLQQKAQKRTSLLLNMEHISDRLAGLKNTVISMPGLSSEGHVIHIEGIYHTVQILPTKTKPKKLVLLGSDGKKYPYLFKGLEDLHLDERIMQFLSIVNNMFAKANKNDQKLYHARHYSVTPLGARSGLIQWVEGATPLFSLYKRWQQREAIAQQLKAGNTSQISQANPPTIPRPSEVYYSKLTPALKEKGITSLENRKEWPISATRKALEELVKDTPSDLLSRELWCCSTSPSEWWNVTQMYSRSTAVMSMIGYIIGLGDRHLDNLLVDLATGEVVHIDYNVCFEKGKGLRVPERVPFRMTQNLESALGLTGIEGTFRLSCEYVIKTMRKGRETLLTLLEAFVYDPLVDWTTGNEGGYTGAFYGGGHSMSCVPEGRQSKREMERDITLSMFAIRVAEMKAAWFANREEMLGALSKLREVVQGHMNCQMDLNGVEQHLHRLQEQLTYVEEAQSDAQHPIYSLGLRYGEFAVVKASRLEVQQAIQEKLTELEHWHKLYEYALQAIQGGQLQRLRAEVSQPYSSSLASFACVVDFLQGAGQAQLVSQCEEVSADLNDVMLRRRVILQSCLDILHTYATITGHFPGTVIKENRNTKWTDWLHEFLCDFTTDKCESVVSGMQALYDRSVNPAAAETIYSTELRLQAITAESNNKLIKLIERRNLDPGETAMLMVHVEDATAAVHVFMQEKGMSGTKCMTSVVVSALCSLSRRYLVMEGAAAGAGERLMDLTSRDGDWFLDELCSMSGNVTHLLGLLNDPSVLQTLSAEVCHQVMQAMNATHSVYMALQDLNMNFHSIILPEAVKALQSQEASVLASLQALDNIATSAGRPMEDLLSAMELQLRHAIMGMELTDEEAITLVKKMRVKFNDLLSVPSASSAMGSELTPGQMLLMGFNGLFSRLDQDFANMLEGISKLQVPDIWRKVDIVKEASSMQLTAFNDSTLGLLSNLYFLKQLKAMQDFFHLASMTAGTLQGVPGGACYDDEQLAKPIKLFIAEYVRKHLIGLPSQTLGLVLCLYVNVLGVDVSAEIELRDIGAECKVSLEDLRKKAVELCIQDESFQHIHLSQASTFIGNVDLAWRKSDLARRLDTNIGMMKTRLQCSQLDLARFQWLNEDALACVGRNASQMAMPARATVMAELRNCVQSLMSQETAVTSVIERHSQLESSVSQRLKWAAGANPSLTGVLQQYEETLTAKNQIVQSDSNLANEVFNICNGALHLETLRTNTPEAVAADSAFLALIARCEESCQLIESCTSTVTEVEESVMTSRPLQIGDQVTEDWLNNAVEGIMVELTDLNSRITTVTSNVETTKEGVKGQVNAIRNVLTTHHQLMSDIRTILKSMARQEEHDFGQEVFDGSIRQYVGIYKTFSENFTTVLKLVMSEELGQEVMNEIDAMLATLTRQITVIYDDLVNYAPPIKTGSKEETGGKMDFASAAANRTASTSSDTNYPPASPKKLALARADLRSGPYAAASSRRAEKIARDPRTGKAIQERNSYALGVWRRVKMKLDGRDPDINKRYSVAEQVDYVIQEATSVDNLAVLYEGWTPWV